MKLMMSFLDALLADLDGDHTPTPTLGGPPDLASSEGSPATMLYTAPDMAPTVSCRFFELLDQRQEPDAAQ